MCKLAALKNDAYEIHNQRTFDSYCKKVVKNELYSFYHEVKRQLARESCFSELGARQATHLPDTDEDPLESRSFHVLEDSFSIRNDLLADALAVLPTRKRNIMLLYYCFDRADKEIGELLGMVRQTVQYQRNNILKQLSAMMKEHVDE